MLLEEGRWLRTFAREVVRALYVGVRVFAPVAVLSGRGGGRRREDVFARSVVFERLRFMGVDGGGRRLALGVSSSESPSSSLSPSEESSSEEEGDLLASSSSDELSSYCCTTGVLLLLELEALEDVGCVECMMS